MLIESREVKLTPRIGISVRRSLPHSKLKMIGAWCFVDHFGPTEQTDGMVVAAHPHIGLQTVTWLFEGLIEHRDSLGTIQLIEPGQLNLMTAGRGISHSERSLLSPGNLHAVQLWAALPNANRDMPARFEHQPELPIFSQRGIKATILVGDYLGLRSPTSHFSPLVGAELRLEPGVHRLPLREEFEHGLLLVQGAAEIEGSLPVSSLEYLPKGRRQVEVRTMEGAILVLLGGEPFPEKILMWWNFIGRTHDEIAQARQEWNSRQSRFGSFEDSIGGWIPAPEMPSVRLQAR